MSRATLNADEIVGEHRLRVRYGECDSMGIAYHPHYLVWFHEARDALMVNVGVDFAAIERLGYRFPISDITCRYVRSAKFRDEIAVVTRVKPEPVARLHFRFEALHQPSRDLLARGEVVMVVTDASGRLLMRLPDELRELIKGSALDSERVRARGRS